MVEEKEITIIKLLHKPCKTVWRMQISPGTPDFWCPKCKTSKGFKIKKEDGSK